MTKTKTPKKLNLAANQIALAANAQDNIDPRTLPATTDAILPVDGETLHLNLTTEAIKAVCLLSSSLLFAAPAFATQANPQNIISLADMFFRYSVGNIAVAQPSDEVASATPPTAPTFG